MLRRRRVAGWLAALSVCAQLPLNAEIALASSGGPSPPGLQAVNPGPNGYFEATLAPGGHQSFAVLVKNLGDTTAVYRVYPADGTTSAVTGVEYSQVTPPPTGAGSWINLATQQVTLPKGSQQQVAFEVTVPADAGPGDHVAAVASYSPTGGQVSTNGSGNVSLSITARVVLAVVVHVPGPTHTALQVGQPSFGIENGGRQVLVIPLDDTGDLLFKPHLSGTVTPCQSASPGLTIDRQLDTFVPHTRIGYAYHILSGRLPQGCYTLDLHTDYPGGALGAYHGNVQLGAVAAGTATTLNRGGNGQAGPTKHNSTSGLVTALEVAAGLLVLAVLFLLILLFRRRRKKEEDQTQPRDETSESTSTQTYSQND